MTGIDATNNGTGALSITVSGAVSGGAGGSGIDAVNAGTGLTILAVGQNGIGTNVSGAQYGIFADNNGTVAVSITAGNVSSTGTDTYYGAAQQVSALPIPARI